MGKLPVDSFFVDSFGVYTVWGAPKTIKLVLLSIKMSKTEPEGNARYSRESAQNAVIPDQKRVCRECCRAACVQHQHMYAMLDVPDLQTKASVIALAIADMNKKIAMTSERIFFGAFVYAYSNPVILVKISETATRM